LCGLFVVTKENRNKNKKFHRKSESLLNIQSTLSEIETHSVKFGIHKRIKRRKKRLNRGLVDLGMEENVVCPISKPGKESARNCAKGLLIKVMRRNIIAGEEGNQEEGYSPDDIERAIYGKFPSRDLYLAKIAKVALHLSLFTRTGRVSYTFQERIFNRTGSSLSGGFNSDPLVDNDDFLDWLINDATGEEIFPELYQSGRYITKIDRNRFEMIMRLELDAIIGGLNFVVRQCCDSKVCTLSEINTSYDQELFKEGTPFETAIRSQCMVRKIDNWIPPSSDIMIPDTTPYIETQPVSEAESRDLSLGIERNQNRDRGQSRTKVVAAGVRQERNQSEISRLGLDRPELNRPGFNSPPEMILGTEQGEYEPGVAESDFGEDSDTEELNREETDVDSGEEGISIPLKRTERTEAEVRDRLIEDQRQQYQSQPSSRSINRNFELSGYVYCFSVDNLIHNLAILEPGKRLELPFDGVLLDSEIQDELYQKFRVEIQMRRYFLSRFK